MPWRSAPAWAETPPPCIVAMTSIFSSSPTVSSAVRIVRCSAGRGKKTSSVRPLISVGAGAGLEDHARDGGLALAGRGVARAGGQVDRGVGDRLGELLLGGVAVGVAVLVLVLAAQGLLALAHDVDLEVHAGDLRLDARGLLDVILVLPRRAPRPRVCGGGLRGGGLRLGSGGRSAAGSSATGSATISCSRARCSSLGVSWAPTVPRRRSPRARASPCFSSVIG